ncbi:MULTISPECIES: hypothetical protein [Hyphobacterium]|uniref:DUF4440 domain-containing protein n=1 Tax=Hyphobacterium vulgare TaxID=1736751 RepID=A0ABV6ZYJ8_9PROT
MILRAFLVLVAGLAVSACSVRIQPFSPGASPEQIEDMADRSMTAEESALVTQAYEALLSRQPETVFDSLAAHLQTDASLIMLEDMATAFPDEAPVRSDRITFHLNTVTASTGDTRRTVTNQWALTYENGEVISVFIRLVTGDGEPLHIESYNYAEANPAAWAPPERLTPAHFAVIAAGIAFPLIILVTLVAIFRIRRIKRRWLWVIAAIITVPTVQFGWTFGQFAWLAPAIHGGGGSWSMQLMVWVATGVEVTRIGIYQPWIVTLGVPLGAVWFWLRYLTGGIARKPEVTSPPEPADRPPQSSPPLSPNG